MTDRMTKEEAVAIVLGCGLEEAASIDLCELTDEDADMIEGFMYGNEEYDSSIQSLLIYLRREKE